MKTAFLVLAGLVAGTLPAGVAGAETTGLFPDTALQIAHCTAAEVPTLRVFAFSETEGIVYAEPRGLEEAILVRADLEPVDAGAAVRVVPRVQLYPPFTVAQGENTQVEILELQFSCNASW
jgi:hypothetical protein